MVQANVAVLAEAEDALIECRIFVDAALLSSDEKLRKRCLREIRIRLSTSQRCLRNSLDTQKGTTDVL